MPNNKQFAELLESYLAGNNTPGEYQELMRLIKTGDHDAVLKEYIDDSLLNEEITAAFEGNRSNEILNTILHSEKHTAKLIPMAKPIKRYLRSTAVAAAIIIVLISTWWFLPVKNGQENQVAKNTSKTLQPAVDSKGKKYIRLQDGSTVLLNNGSRLEYPDEFKGKLREVTLVGEAYFDIHHDASRPFIVHTGKVSTVVLGTAFNIKAYPLQKEITVTVTRGKVKVGDSSKTYGVVTPNESISVNTAINTFKKEMVNAEDMLAWKKDYLVLDDITLADAAILINSRYHINISFSKEALKACHISATFLNNETLEQVLTVVTGVVNASYTMQPNDQVIISGEGCQ